jgi:hypothetical protein
MDGLVNEECSLNRLDGEDGFKQVDGTRVNEIIKKMVSNHQCLNKRPEFALT